MSSTRIRYSSKAEPEREHCSPQSRRNAEEAPGKPGRSPRSLSRSRNDLRLPKNSFSLRLRVSAVKESLIPSRQLPWPSGQPNRSRFAGAEPSQPENHVAPRASIKFQKLGRADHVIDHVRILVVRDVGEPAA